MLARQLTCVGLAFATFYVLLAILWAFWFTVFVDFMPNSPGWMLALAMGVAVLSGLALYFFAVWWEVSLVMKCPASQAKRLVVLSGTLPLVSLAFVVWCLFRNFNVLAY